MNNTNFSNYDQAIKEHYDKVAIENKDKPSCTMDNDFVRDSETKFIIDTIKKYIKLQKKRIQPSRYWLWKWIYTGCTFQNFY